MGSKKTIVVNFLAGSGTGKTTTATDVFQRLKKANIECELAMEYAKDLVWGNNPETLLNQIHVFGEQFLRIDRLIGKVDVVITDSPLLLSIMFKDHHLFKHSLIENLFDKLVVEIFKTYNNLNFYIERSVPFNPKGRIEKNIEEAIEKDNEILQILYTNNIQFISIKNSEEDIENICTNN